MIENWVVGIKFWEIYEMFGFLLLIQVYQELESLMLVVDVLCSKWQLEMQWVDFVYQGFWFGFFKDVLDGFMDCIQIIVNGVVCFWLYKGMVMVIGCGLVDSSFYVFEMVFYGSEDQFDY